MTARGIHAGEHAQDAEDLDVEEVLALVNEGSTGSGDPAVPSPSASPSHAPQGNPRKPDTDQHKATPWPEARAIAGRAART
ncbi:molybdopterin molybdenumtransferase MoeA, partial [Streptomyces prunicolor]|nr:molybdopterin molybdenumtransferase MoeA [Streptomyces prunicolor]